LNAYAVHLEALARLLRRPFRASRRLSTRFDFRLVPSQPDEKSRRQAVELSTRQTDFLFPESDEMLDAEVFVINHFGLAGDYESIQFFATGTSARNTAVKIGQVNLLI
jgi:hypothetical protein